MQCGYDALHGHPPGAATVAGSGHSLQGLAMFFEYITVAAAVIVLAVRFALLPSTTFKYGNSVAAKR